MGSKIGCHSNMLPGFIDILNRAPFMAVHAVIIQTSATILLVKL